MLLSKAWETYKLDKRIEGFSPQTLKAYQLQVNLLIRHFGDIEIDLLSTEKLNNGAPLEVIQSLMGHEKNETTRIYAELSGRLRKEFYQKYF